MLKFKTNIKCNGCIQKVTPKLDTFPGIKKWSVDLNDPDRTLTIEDDGADSEELVAVLKKIGYTAEQKA